MSKIIVIVSLFLVINSFCQVSTQPTPNNGENPAFVFGTTIDKNSVLKQDHFKYQASLEKNSKHWCGAIVITSKAVISAAHCTVKQDPKILRIRLGTILRENGGKTYAVNSYVNHPKYNDFDRQVYGVSENDISLIFLQKEIQYYSPVMLPSSNYVPGSDYVVSGWGGLKDHPMDTLKYSYIRVWERNDCEDFVRNPETQLCASAVNPKEGHCKGDSGGPLVHFNEKLKNMKSKSPILIGIVSGIVNGCANKDSIMYYTNVYAFKSWIEQTIKSKK